MSDRSGARFRRVRLYSLQFLGTLVVVLLALEAWARLFPPKDEVVWPLVQNPAVGTTFVPGSKVVFTNGLDFHVEEQVNEAGFLDRPLPPLAKPRGACRIAFVGDSFIEAAQVPIRQKVQVRVEELAKVRWPALEVEGMAVGFSGTGQLNQLAYFDAFLRPRRPDVVVLVFVSNDFANNSSLLEAVRVGWHPDHTPRLFAREPKPGAPEFQPIDPAWQSHLLPRAIDDRPWLHARLHRASRFYRWVYAKLTLQYPGLAQRMGREPTEADRTMTRVASLKSSGSGFGGLLEGWDPARGPGIDAMFREPDPLPPAFAQALRFTVFAFDAYKKRAAEDGFELVVLATHEIEGRLEARLRQMLGAKAIPYLAMREFIGWRGGMKEQAHWRHDSHWSPQGHTWAAEQVLEHIAGQKLCGRS